MMSRRISEIVTRRLTWAGGGAGAAASPARDGRDAAVGDEPLRDVERLLRVAGGGDGAGQNDRAANRAHVDVVVGNGGLEQALQLGDVAADGHFEHGDLVAVGAESEDGRLSGLQRRDIEPPRRAHDRVGDGGIADEDFLRVLGQVDNHRAADAELQALDLAASDRGEGCGRRIAGESGRGGAEGAERRHGEDARPDCALAAGAHPFEMTDHGSLLNGPLAGPRRSARW
jgi:hypothetical protein